ncbi:TetR/AcrR family transcriptional regulator [bacterium]|jgi:AcrR family transcriptional regulator|nr:TetR/AcrR family transcriptional regulator [bacterium]
MARQIELDRDELKEKMIQTAFQLVEKGGPKALSARKISTNLDVSIGTLYNVVNSLDIIKFHVKARILDQFFNKLRENAGTNNWDKNTLHNIADIYLAFVTENKNLWRLVLEETSTPYPLWYLKEISDLFTYLESILASITGISLKTAKQSIFVLWAGLQGLSSLYQLNKINIVSETSFEEHVKFLLDSHILGITTFENQK